MCAASEAIETIFLRVDPDRQPGSKKCAAIEAIETDRRCRTRYFRKRQRSKKCAAIEAIKTDENMLGFVCALA